MDYDKEMKRLGGHDMMKELPEYHEEIKTAAGTAPRVKSGSGYNGGAIIASVAAVAVAMLVFFLSDSHFGRGVEQYEAGNTVYDVITVEEVTTGINPAVYATNVPQTGEISAPGTLVEGTAADVASATSSTTDTSSPDAVCLFPTSGAGVAENAQLNAVARKAVETDADVRVVGYTDESGSEAYNRLLSERRAQAVCDYLVAHGVDRKHITVEGLGETHAFPTDAQDRRAEVFVG